jgi:hypothetical protein
VKKYYIDTKTVRKEAMRKYNDFTISLSGNRKTKYIIDVTKGCIGARVTDGGCYHSCFSLKMARMAGVDFAHTVIGTLNEDLLLKQLKKVKDQSYIRIGVAGDPSEAWELTVKVSQLIHSVGIVPIVTTKVWREPTLGQLEKMAKANVFLHISCSGLDRDQEIERRIKILQQYKACGGNPVMRIVSAPFKLGTGEQMKQEQLVLEADKNKIPILETPLRVFKNVWYFNKMDETKLKHHVSIFSGKPDSQLTAGFILTNDPNNMCYACKECKNECQPKYKE